MASYLAGAICGQFVCGDGTVVQTPVFHADKARLILAAKPYAVVTGNIVTVRAGTPRLILSAKGYALVATSIVTLHKARMTLKAGAYFPIVPVQVHVGKAKLTLTSRPYTLKLSQAVPVGKARMILVGGSVKKVGRAGLVPTHCIEVTLVPTTRVTV